MTPAEVQSIRDQVGGTKAMAEMLHIGERAARSLCQNGAKRPSTIERLKALSLTSKQGGMRIVSEPEFHARLAEVLASLPVDNIGSVTGPGRSGAVAAVYASHQLGVPFLPYGSKCPVHLGRLLIIDTARESGVTLRKAGRRYGDANPVVAACFEEPPRVAFWYEAAKPQRFRHERRPAA